MTTSEGKPTPDDLACNRRRFLEYFAAIGVTTSLAPGAAASPGSGTAEITVEDIAAAEKIAGIVLTEAERGEIVDDLNRDLRSFESVREKAMDNSVAPALVFNPIPPGVTFPTEERPVEFSEVEVDPSRGIEHLPFLSVLELASMIRRREITSTELTEVYLERLKDLDPDLLCVVNLTEELARRQAKRADEEIAAGEYRGPLHGIPWGAKDLLAVRGYPTTWGAEPYRDQVIDVDATVVRRLEEAGAVLVAKLSLGALATGDVWYRGKTRNPWVPSRGSSGSSAGPASATAAGCVAFALGTETNGSILSPCDECGVTGLRPTFGRVSKHGAMALSWSMDKIGPICRSVEDCAVVLDAIRGPDGKDGSVIDLPFNWSPGLDPRKLRVGYYQPTIDEDLTGGRQGGRREYTRAKQAMAREALDVLRAQGIEIEPLDFDISADEIRSILTIESAAAFEELTRSDRDDLIENSHWPQTFRHHRFTPAVEYIQANRYRTLLMQRMHEVMKDIDVYVEITHSNTGLTNLTGHPAVIVPCGFHGPRPVGLTFVGKLFGEAETLAVAKAYQDATDHHLRYPDL